MPTIRLSHPIHASVAVLLGLQNRRYEINEDVDVNVTAYASLIEAGFGRAIDGATGRPNAITHVYGVAGLAGPYIGAQTLADALSDLISGGTVGTPTNTIPLSQKGAPLGVATLDINGLIPTVQIPPLTLGEVFDVANQTQMLGLLAHRGALAYRSDNGQVYLLVSDSPNNLGDWKPVVAGGQVVSVNGRSGVVLLSAGDVGAVPTDRRVLSSTGTLTGIGDLTADRDLAVVANKTVQRVEIARNGTVIATRKQINFIAGPNVSVTAADNTSSDRVDLVISAATGGTTSTPTTGATTATVTWVPSDPTGVTDMTAEVEAVRSANPKAMIQCRAGSVVRLNGAFQSVTSGDILVDFTDCTVLYDNNSAAGCAIKCDATGNASSEVSVSSVAMAQVNSNVWTSRLTLAGTLSAKAFDWLAVYSNDPNPAKSGGFLGEIVQVLNDESGLQVSLTRRLNRHAAYSATVKARRLDATRRVHIRGGVFKAIGNTQSTSVTIRAIGIIVQGFVDPLVENVSFDHPWAQGVRFGACAGPRARGVEIRNAGNLADYNGFTYGVTLYGMNDAADVRDLTVRNSRHGFTTDGNSGSTTTWYLKGIPTNFGVDGVHGTNCHGSVIDTHEEGDGGTVMNVFAAYSYQDAIIAAGAGFTGTAIQHRCSNTTFRNIMVTGGTRGIRVNAVDHGFEDRAVFDNIRVHNTTHATDGDIGVQIDDMNALVNVRHVILRGAEFDDVGLAVKVGKNAKLTVPALSARRCKTFLDAAAGSDIVFTGSCELDYRTPTRVAPFQAILQRSDAVLGGASVVFTQAPTVIRGTSPSPTVFVEETDTAASKKLWVPELFVFDEQASGAPSIIAASATTFDPALVYRVAGYFTDNDPGTPVDPPPPPPTYPAQLLSGLGAWELTLPTGASGDPDDIYQPALSTYSSTYFKLNTAKDGVVFYTPVGGGFTTPNSSFQRSELREMVAGYSDTADKAAWGSNDGKQHTMTITQSIDHLPDKRPIVICGQVHAADAQSFFFVIADGFYPTTGTTAVTGSSTNPFTIRYKVNDASSNQVEAGVLLSNYKMGQTFTVRVEVAQGAVKVFCDLGTAASTLRATITSNVPSTGLYFKAGTYNQASIDNSSKTVPTGTCVNGTNLTSPAAGATVANDAASAYGQVTIKALGLVHAAIPDTGNPGDPGDPGNPTITYPAQLTGPMWKITRPDATASEVKQPDFGTYSDANFHLTSTKAGVVFSARCGAGTTSNSTNPRCELREMQGSPDYVTLAAWKALSGGSTVHTMIYTASIDELPIKKPEVVVGQIHATVDPPDDQFVVFASGFYPTTGTKAVTGTDTSTGFNLRIRWLGSVSFNGSLLPVIISNLHIGEKFSIKIQVTGNRYRVWAMKDPNATRDFTGVAEATASVNLTLAYTGDNYFKLGAYVQSNLKNDKKTVPSGTCAGGANLTDPPASSLTGGDASTAGSTVTIWGKPTITHV
jgi:hypothetical protein